jgi:hypothetical protein
VGEVGEVGAEALEPPTPLLQRPEALRHGGAPRQHLSPLARDPVAQVAHPPERGALAQLGRADGHAVEELLGLREARGRREQGAHAVARQAVGLGEGIELDQRVVPIGVLEQRVGRAVAAVEVAVGLVHHERDAARPAEVAEGREEAAWVLHARRVVGRHEHDGAGEGREERGRQLGVGQHPRADGQGHGPYARHVVPHAVVEVPGRDEDHLVALGAERRHGRAVGLVAARRDGDLLGAHHAAVGRRPVLGDLRTQLVKAQHGAVEVREGLVEHEVGHGLPQGLGRGGHRGRLRDVDEGEVRRRRDAVEPAPRLHDGRLEGHLGAGEHVSRAHGRARRTGAPCPRGRRSRCPATPP